jgi:predicted transposase/invertase (TIGR01784 family)
MSRRELFKIDQKMMKLAAREEGLQTGLQTGLQQGERAAARKIAGKLLQQGLAAPVIASATGLSLREIKALAPVPRRTRQPA